jgi:hypothetical protein
MLRLSPSCRLAQRQLVDLNPVMAGFAERKEIGQLIATALIARDHVLAVEFACGLSNVAPCTPVPVALQHACPDRTPTAVKALCGHSRSRVGRCSSARFFDGTGHMAEPRPPICRDFCDALMRLTSSRCRTR